MDTSPLVIDEIDAGREFLKRLNAYRPVIAACWLRKDENEERYLYAALEGLTFEKTSDAYNEVLRITKEMTDLYLDPFRVKLVGEDDPVARAVRETYRRYPGRMPTRLNDRIFTGMSVTEVYIYPPLAGAP